MQALVIGASGLVGGALSNVLRIHSVPTVGTAWKRPAPGLRSLDMRNAGDLESLFGDIKPDVLCLPAALTNVDLCEERPDEASSINVAPVQLIASHCAATRCRLIFYSTDYVFDGCDGPYAESAKMSPINVYGRLKGEAERIIQESGAPHIIIRTTGVYGWDPASKNFAMQVWQRLGAGERMRVPVDQFANPTLADWLAEATWSLVERGFEGTIHVA